MAHSVLIVDDDKHFRSEFRAILEKEYDVFEAATGEKALEIIKQPNMIDLVMLDVRMPGMQGTEVLKHMKHQDPGLIIIIFTGYGSKEVIIEALQQHADDFLEKPLKIETTLQRIKQHLLHKQNAVKGVIGKLKFFLEKNFDKDVGLKEASQIVCLSPKYISKIFKEETGTGFNTYKLRLKIARAKELLQAQVYNINEIANKIGYMNVESFIRIFKKQEGLTPAEYKRNMQK